jgi:hypothetical protein
MNIKQLGSLLMAFLLLACEQPKQNLSDYSAFSCIKAQSVCTITSDFGDILVTFNVKQVVAESPFTVQVAINNATNSSADKNPETFRITGHIEGKSMYMGKIPLFFQQTKHAVNYELEKKHAFHSAVLLGSCNEDPMYWSMLLTIENSAGKQQSVVVEFSSRYR